VRKERYSPDDWFDLWLPELAPSRALLAYATERPVTPARWRTFRRRYTAEMKRPGARRLIALLSAQSRQADFSVGCYCDDPQRCHRSILADLLREAGATMAA
jgi:uncharacterized protein YeaO (DUF488 family)